MGHIFLDFADHSAVRIVRQIPITKFPAYRQAGKLQINSNFQSPNPKRELFGVSVLVLVIGDWSLFGYWCLEFGYSRIYHAAYAPNFLNFNPLANSRGRRSTAGNLPNSPR
jgi:hypothetical protein